MKRVFILFDAYGTLVELDDFYRRLRSGFVEAGFTYPEEAIKVAAHQEMHHYIRGAKNAHDFASHEKLRNECAQILADSLNGIPAKEGPGKILPHDVAYRVLDAAVVFAPFAETHEVLSQLQRRGVPMGVASNWDYALPQVLRNLDLAQYFEFILTSAQMGAEKPDAQFFNIALREIEDRHPQLTPQSTIYVGDHYEKDVLTPQSLGINAQWIVRDARDIASGDTHTASGVTPLHSLRDLLSLESLREDRVLVVSPSSGAAR